MLAAKRPRRAASAEDLLDPRVMTERQQLAFLLRATAPSDASESSSSSSSSGFSSDEEEVEEEEYDDDDDEPPRRQRAAKRGHKARANYTSGTTEETLPEALPVIYCGRGRPPKNSIKLPRNTLHPYARSARISPRSRHTRSADAEVATAVAAKLRAEKLAVCQALRTERKEIDVRVRQDKTSPSSASDVAMLNSSVGTPLCALCCDLEPFCDAPLFLCPACDRKYPTQQTLGRVCMT